MPSHDQIVIQCESLSKQYVLENGKAIEALDNITLNIYSGSITGVVGKNGCGKTTLLKVLSGIVKPTSGRAYIYGKMLSILDIGAGFHFELTGRENVFLVAMQFGLDKKATEKLLPDIIEFSEMREFMDVAVKFYSQGMYLRLAMSSILFFNADIYLFDEVIAVGDVAFQEKCIAKIRELNSKGVSIILVSHSYNDIQKLCDRCIVLSHGRVIGDGSPLMVKEIFEDSVYPNNRLTEFQDAQFEFFHNDHLSIKSFKVKVAGKAEGEKYYTEDKLIFTIEWTKIDPQMGVAFHIEFLNENENPFLTTSNSFAKNDEELESLRKIAPGSYTDNLVIPPHFFNTGILKVDLFVIGFQNREDHFLIAQTVTPMMIRINEKESDLYFSKVLSPLRIPMAWEQSSS